MPEQDIPTNEARERLAELLGRVHHAKARIRITRHGKAVAALVPIEDLVRLEALEDQADVAAAEKALADHRKHPKSAKRIEVLAEKYEMEI